MIQARQVYRVLSHTERGLLLSYVNVPIYAVRVLIYLYIYPRSTMKDLNQEFGMDLSSVHRVVNEYLHNYISTDTRKIDDSKRPVNVYSLSRIGLYYIEDILQEFNKCLKE